MRKLFFFIVCILAIGTLKADEKISFTASAPDAVVVGDQFQVVYTVTTQKIKDFRAPTMTGFEVLMGPMRAFRENHQIINGNRSSVKSVAFTYTLHATGEGTFQIPGATVEADGKQMTSNALNIRVLPQEKSASSGNNNSGNSSRNNNNNRQQGSTANHNTVADDDLFVRVSASKTNVYEQEAFLLTYKIYSAIDLRNFANEKLPDFKGFHSQEMEGNREWSLEHYRGRNYKTYVYRQFVLFPQQPGKLTIEAARFEATVARVIRSADPFDAFFNGGTNVMNIKKTLNTPALTIDVNPLPPGKPSDFSGGVGTFTMNSSINSQEVKTNDALTLKITLSGIGNLKLFSNPEVKFPDDFERYDPNVETNSVLTTEGLSGNRIIEYLAVPRHAGEYKIPAIRFSYFDIKDKAYKTLTTGEYNITVNRGSGNAEQVISNFTNKENLRVLGEDIRFIKLTDHPLKPKNTFFLGSTTYYLWYVVPALLFIVFVIIYRKKALENANDAKVKNKKANKVAIRRMKLAGKLLSENKQDAFYDEIMRALWGYISDKLNIPVSELSKDNVEQKLMDIGVSEELINEFLAALNECEFARYAPGDPAQAMDKVYNASIEVISKMENSIK